MQCAALRGAAVAGVGRRLQLDAMASARFISSESRTSGRSNLTVGFCCPKAAPMGHKSRRCGTSIPTATRSNVWGVGCATDKRRSMPAGQPIEVVKPRATRRGHGPGPSGPPPR
jgi:hypothetical protein